MIHECIAEYQSHISSKLIDNTVIIVVQFCFDSTKIHGPLDYVEVVGNVELLRIHGLHEWVCVLVLEQIAVEA